MVPAQIEGLATYALAAAALLAGIGAALALVRVDHRAAMIAATAAATACAVAGFGVIVGPTVAVRFGSVLGYSLLDVRFDALSGVFLVALGIVGVATSLYGIGYHDAGRSRLDTLAYLVFLVSLALVFGSASAFGFLFAWELMALSSAVLVIGPRPSQSVVRAGYIYVAIAHLATAAIAIAFATLAAAAGSTEFETWGTAAASLGASARDVLFVLLLVGFGTKAGVIPLHVWLPRAHPVAPSHVSALMSGVMIKAGIYGFIRFGVQTLDAGPPWWGGLVLGIGAASAILGVLYALAEHDLKRLLAFHSVENIGIILLGIGVAMLGMTARAEPLVVLGLAGALFHTLNHAAFKALLFLCAGAVQDAVHTRNLNRLGGLARAMPLTAVAFGLGAAAISGLPPLNGFASEWLVFQGLLTAGGTIAIDPILRLGGYLAVGALALTAALAVACFVKATGMAFLAMPRSTAAAEAHEVGWFMRIAMVGLAVACLVLGLAAGPIGIALTGVVAGVTGGREPVPTPPVGPSTIGPYDPLVVSAALAGLLVAALAVVRIGAKPVRRAPTWTCGLVPEPAFEYTATSFSKPLRLFFEPILRPTRATHVELHEGTPFPRRITYHSEVDHVIETRLYGPVHRASVAFAQIARRLQQGTLQLYLAYTVGAVIVLLLVARR
jgi:hydrogenase-4 component B